MKRLIVLISLVLFLLLMAGADSQPMAGGQESVTTIGVYAFWDPDLSQNVTEVDFGDVVNGTRSDVTLYLQSASNVSVTLNIATSNYAPADGSEYLTLTWDYDGSTLHPSDVITVTLTLWAHSRSKDFDVFAFDIIIEVAG